MLDQGGSVPRRLLASMLLSARKKSGLTQKQAADRIDISPSTLGRMESGAIPSKLTYVQSLCRLYEVDAGETGVMEALALESKAKGWWTDFGDAVPDWFEPYLSLEASAFKIRWSEAELVPGLLQTIGYAEVLIRADNPGKTSEEIDRRVKLRMNRQKLLTDRDPRLQVDAIVGEAILRRPVGGPRLMADQLQHLLELSELPNVTLWVLPFEVGFHPGMLAGPYELLEFPERDTGNGKTVQDPVTVYSENVAGGTFWDNPRSVNRFREAWSKELDCALDEKASRDFIATVAKEWR